MSKLIQSQVEKYYRGMPEFTEMENNSNKYVCELKVNFRTKEDVLEFSKLIGYEITQQTRSITYPIRPRRNLSSHYWTVEDEK